ncbi:MAG: hypothetical protein CVV50_01545 [Spirochaetae bacterium HGW-Spirochaetae-6]|jgi:hypothetical protein|nr:MAG: hypothetical protein CVV50_01545 [Spirochaetae bacterium HGW-Spirochaetae-6]
MHTTSPFIKDRIETMLYLNKVQIILPLHDEKARKSLFIISQNDHYGLLQLSWAQFEKNAHLCLYLQLTNLDWYEAEDFILLLEKLYENLHFFEEAMIN